MTMYKDALPIVGLNSLSSLVGAVSTDEEEDMNDVFEPRSRLSVSWKPVKTLLHNSRGRKLAGDFIDSHTMHIFMGVLIVVNSVLVIIQTDARADGIRLPVWEDVASTILMSAFVFELGCRMYAQQRHFFLALFNVVELVIVSGDVVLSIYSWTHTNTLSVGYLRLMRLARFFRILRLLSGFRELFMMLHGMQSAMKAMAWSILMVAVVILIWSIIAVEFVRPAVRHLAKENVFPDQCTRCGRAFDSVWDASLTLMSTIIAGDAWGELAIPVMESYPVSALFFFGSFMMINLGLMNLIMAVIVDRAAEARREDEEHILQEKKQCFKVARLKLYKLCRRLDKNRDGILSGKELREGVFNEPDFADILKLMDVTMEDLDQVFAYLDMDGSGDITYKEFIHQLHRLKTADSHTVLMLLGQQVKHIFNKLGAQLDDRITNLRKSLTPLSQVQMRAMDPPLNQVYIDANDLPRASAAPQGPYGQFGSDDGFYKTSASPSPSSPGVSAHLGSEPKDVSESAAVRDSIAEHVFQKFEALDAALRLDLERIQETLNIHISSAMASSTDLIYCSSKEVVAEENEDAPHRRVNASNDKLANTSVEARPCWTTPAGSLDRCSNRVLQDAGMVLTKVRQEFPLWPRIQL